MALTKAPNPTLKGHKALIIVPWPPVPQAIQALKNQFPGLDVTAIRQLDWKDPNPYAHLTKEQWAEFTILLSGTAWPLPEDAPKVVFAQLPSAGANHIMTNPIFKDTDIPFCSATGVHGSVPLVSS